MTNYIIPIFLVTIFITAIIKKAPIYDNFVYGIKDALNLVMQIFPYICAVFIAIELMNVSGLTVHISRLISPIFEFFGIPGELSELLIIKPLSGNASIAMLNNIYQMHGVDSYIARCASVITGCSETIFYISAVYFSTSKSRKLRYCIPVALISTFAGAVISCLLCRVI